MKGRKYWAKKKIVLHWKSDLNLDVRADMTVTRDSSTLRDVLAFLLKLYKLQFHGREVEL